MNRFKVVVVVVVNGRGVRCPVTQMGHMDIQNINIRPVEKLGWKIDTNLTLPFYEAKRCIWDGFCMLFRYLTIPASIIWVRFVWVGTGRLCYGSFL